MFDSKIGHSAEAAEIDLYPVLMQMLKLEKRPQVHGYRIEIKRSANKKAQLGALCESKYPPGYTAILQPCCFLG
jgi:hypothetical protein